MAAGQDHDRPCRAADDRASLETGIRQFQRFGDGVPAGGGAENFSTGIDSPVIADWLTKKSFAARMRRSAGMTEPAARTTMSPGTTSADIDFQFPTVADNHGPGLDHFFQLFGRFDRAAFLKKR